MELEDRKENDVGERIDPGRSHLSELAPSNLAPSERAASALVAWEPAPSEPAAPGPDLQTRAVRSYRAAEAAMREWDSYLRRYRWSAAARRQPGRIPTDVSSDNYGRRTA